MSESPPEIVTKLLTSLLYDLGISETITISQYRYFEHHFNMAYAMGYQHKIETHITPSRPVRKLMNGRVVKEYFSLSKAARDSEVCPGAINFAISRKSTDRNGFQWEYVKP